MKRMLIVSIHGILTGQTAQAWQERFKLFVYEHAGKTGTPEPWIETLERQYWAGICAPFTVFVKNHFLAAELADEVMEYLDAEDAPEVCFLSHSNGADIAVKTMKILARNDKKVKAAVFIAGAINADVTTNGIGDLINSGALGKAVSYYSWGDRVFEILIMWPYGRLGRSGWTQSGLDNDDNFDSGAIAERNYSPFDHGTYFEPDHETATFNQVLEDFA